MICDFCNGSGKDREYSREDCADCAGTGIATCGSCGDQADVLHSPDGPEYVCIDCLAEKTCIHCGETDCDCAELYSEREMA